MSQYVVQQSLLLDGSPKTPVWVDLGGGGFFEGPNQRKAIEAAMEANELQEGDFRAIPAGSAKTFSPRAKMQVVWGPEAGEAS